MHGEENITHLTFILLTNALCCDLSEGWNRAGKSFNSPVREVYRVGLQHPCGGALMLEALDN